MQKLASCLSYLDVKAPMPVLQFYLSIFNQNQFALRWAGISRNLGTGRSSKAKEARLPSPGDGQGCLPAILWLQAAPWTDEEVITVKTLIVSAGARDTRAL